VNNNKGPEDRKIDALMLIQAVFFNILSKIWMSAGISQISMGIHAGRGNQIFE
jgi:hypothetical protein